MINAVLRLRRDNDFNYEKIKDTFVPANGEICLVDTAREGLRAVCGDGKSPFASLSFMNDLIQKGYYKDGTFYKDSAYTEKLVGYTTRIYIDLTSSIMYYYSGESYIEVSSTLPRASAQTPGVMNLYETTGQNVDGTMTQKAITDELNTKVEMTLREEEELVIFSL